MKLLLLLLVQLLNQTKRAQSEIDMIGGIDNQIQQRIMASGNNPDRLMQSYNQKKQLIDLLALQKLKSDKEAAARNMQMQMQQNPQTIKDQREAEVLDMTKQELAQQVGKTLAQKQQQSQQNLQRVANQGIANAPAANRMRMANGGIVGFAGPTGSEVTLEDYQNVDLSGVKYGQHMTPQYKKIKSKQRDAKLLDRYKDLLDRQGRLNYLEVKELERLQRKFSPEVGADGPEPSEAQPPMGPTPNFVAPEESPAVAAQEESALAGSSEIGAEAMRRVDEALGGQGEPPPAEQPPAAPNIPVTLPQNVDATGIAKITAPQLDYSGDTAGQGLEAVYKGMSEIDPSAARETGYKSALDKIGYTADEMSGIKALQAEQKALEDKRLDPKKQARDRLISRLLGARGSTLGSTFRTSGLAGERTRGAQEAQEYELFEKRKKDLQDLITKQQGIRSSAYDAAQTDFTEAGRRKDAGITGLRALSDQYQTRVQEQAKLDQAADIQNVQTGIETLKINKANERTTAQILSNKAITEAQIISSEEIAKRKDATQKEANKLLAETNRLKAQSATYDQLNKQLTKVQQLSVEINNNVETALAKDMGYVQAGYKAKEALENGNQEEYTRLVKVQNAIRSRILKPYQEQVDNLSKQARALEDKINAIDFEVVR